MRSRDTIEFLGVWEELNSPSFRPLRLTGSMSRPPRFALVEELTTAVLRYEAHEGPLLVTTHVTAHRGTWCTSLPSHTPRLPSA